METTTVDIKYPFVEYEFTDNESPANKTVGMKEIVEIHEDKVSFREKPSDGGMIPVEKELPFNLTVSRFSENLFDRATRANSSRNTFAARINRHLIKVSDRTPKALESFINILKLYNSGQIENNDYDSVFYSNDFEDLDYTSLASPTLYMDDFPDNPRQKRARSFYYAHPVGYKADGRILFSQEGTLLEVRFTFYEVQEEIALSIVITDQRILEKLAPFTKQFAPT